MTTRTLYAVALTAEVAERILSHSGSNDYVMSDKDNAEKQAARLTELFDAPYKVFAGRVTVEMLED
jgi:hypothetical protein